MVQEGDDGELGVEGSVLTFIYESKIDLIGTRKATQNLRSLNSWPPPAES